MTEKNGAKHILPHLLLERGHARKQRALFFCISILPYCYEAAAYSPRFLSAFFFYSNKNRTFVC
jgi:hypothetical protein